MNKIVDLSKRVSKHLLRIVILVILLIMFYEAYQHWHTIGQLKNLEQEIKGK